MNTDVDTPAALLAELAALGIELRAHGDRLRFRPQTAMTPELAARVKAHKPDLLAMLADTETPAGDATTPGFGSGVGDVLTATSYTAEEARMLAGAPTDSRAAGPHRGSIELPPELAEAFEERAAIMEYEGNMPRDLAEATAAGDILDALGNPKRACY